MNKQKARLVSQWFCQRSSWQPVKRSWNYWKLCRINHMQVIPRWHPLFLLNIQSTPSFYFAALSPSWVWIYKSELKTSGTASHHPHFPYNEYYCNYDWNLDWSYSLFILWKVRNIDSCSHEADKNIDFCSYEADKHWLLFSWLFFLIYMSFCKPPWEILG